MNKKLKISLAVVFVALLSFSTGAYAATKYYLNFNDRTTKTDVRMINKKAYVPLNDISKLFGGKVSYNSKKHTYYVKAKDYHPANSQVKTFNVKATGTSGPMKITISKVTLHPSFKKDSYSSPVRAVVMDVAVENTSKQTVEWYPAQGALNLNTKEQVEFSHPDSDLVEGTFNGQVIKKGKVIYEVKSSLSSIKNLKWSISQPFDNDLNGLGPDIVVPITLIK
ncbi:hypothetical protein [Fictibacillus sp. KU28468]|uniref:hypothetical protein n=1 Tax=Fictibacillus sp. KU28468 TaxID=2991053 RepID=UPI00223DBCA5|nr:hypothetical protein [Fictibacillus sp. KU28468]UZJ79644.1 copper amine oxidase N-terminal domain-containing protein [Fictibacillus sp. KU28468]